MELRHDWATFNFTPELFKYVFTRLIPDVIIHSQHQDEEKVRDHYDRKYLLRLEKSPHNINSSINLQEATTSMAGS